LVGKPHQLVAGAWPAPPARCAGEHAGGGARQLVAGAAGAQVDLHLITGRIRAGAGRARRAIAAVASTLVMMGTSWWSAPAAPRSGSRCSPAGSTLAPAARGAALLTDAKAVR
jgi:hypothetical protein